MLDPDVHHLANSEHYKKAYIRPHVGLHADFCIYIFWWRNIFIFTLYFRYMV